MEAVLRGSLLEIWGGPINYVVGVEDRTRTIRRDWAWFGDRGRERYNTWDAYYSVPEPESGLRAEFMELGFPLVGEKNDPMGCSRVVPEPAGPARHAYLQWAAGRR
ncbi:MAG: hypothetical protein OXH09_03925, partial [Gammaproteobacteria bacterium]|nr:hypothetical protein [Gammaproteobacteria bacterium]